LRPIWSPWCERTAIFWFNGAYELSKNEILYVPRTRNWTGITHWQWPSLHLSIVFVCSSQRFWLLVQSLLEVYNFVTLYQPVRPRKDGHLCHDPCKKQTNKLVFICVSQIPTSVLKRELYILHNMYSVHADFPWLHRCLCMCIQVSGPIFFLYRSVLRSRTSQPLVSATGWLASKNVIDRWSPTCERSCQGLALVHANMVRITFVVHNQICSNIIKMFELNQTCSNIIKHLRTCTPKK
jgi:hypothetical protein